MDMYHMALIIVSVEHVSGGKRERVNLLHFLSFLSIFPLSPFPTANSTTVEPPKPTAGPTDRTGFSSEGLAGQHLSQVHSTCTAYNTNDTYQH